MSIKIVVIIGTRPEAIKLAPVIKEFQREPGFDVKVAVTGQHREMLQQVMDFFQITAHINLDVMTANQTLPELTARMITSISNEVAERYKPDWFVVQGDTTTAMAGAMAGFYNKIKIAHVEAGLRSFNIHSPFPEEMNRCIISKISTVHFCPTDTSVSNLAHEGIKQHVYRTGNTVVDALLLGLKMIDKQPSGRYEKFFDAIDFNKKIVLVTCHRRESFGQPFEDICSALVRIAETNRDYQIVYPVHLNPNVSEKAKLFLGSHKNILLIKPLPYDYLLWLMNRSSIILTDSGGIQEEAPSLNKPVIVLREVTERTEGVEAGTALLVGTDKEKIYNSAILLLENSTVYNSIASRMNPYGDGKASERMRQIIHEWK